MLHLRPIVHPARKLAQGHDLFAGMHSRLAFDRPETKDQAMTDSDRLAIAKAWGLLWASDSTDPCVIEARRTLRPLLDHQRIGVTAAQLSVLSDHLPVKAAS